jgi:hypothetical protein
MIKFTGSSLSFRLSHGERTVSLGSESQPVTVRDRAARPAAATRVTMTVSAQLQVDDHHDDTTSLSSKNFRVQVPIHGKDSDFKLDVAVTVTRS